MCVACVCACVRVLVLFWCRLKEFNLFFGEWCYILVIGNLCLISYYLSTDGGNRKVVVYW